MSEFFLTLPAWQLWLLVFSWFAMLYFGFAWSAQWLTRHWLVHWQMPFPAHRRQHLTAQQYQEIRWSLLSIAVFACQSLLTRYLYASGQVDIRWSLDESVLMEIVVLFFWNEAHFYASHRLLHQPWLFRHVHRIHHQAYIPTPYSTYSFHWFEAFLLGSVMLTAMLFHTFSIVSLILLTIMSLLLNVLGHWHHDLFPDVSDDHLLAFSRRHSLHHNQIEGNYGFVLPWLDRWLHTALPERKA